MLTICSINRQIGSHAGLKLGNIGEKMVCQRTIQVIIAMPDRFSTFGNGLRTVSAVEAAVFFSVLFPTLKPFSFLFSHVSLPAARQAVAATPRRRPMVGRFAGHPLFLGFQYFRAFAMDVNIRVLVQSQFGHRRPASGKNTPTCSTGSAPHRLHFLFFPIVFSCALLSEQRKLLHFFLLPFAAIRFAARMLVAQKMGVELTQRSTFICQTGRCPARREGNGLFSLVMLTCW